MRKLRLLTFLACLILVSCGQKKNQNNGDVIASAYGKSLYVGDIIMMIPENLNEEDSLKWVRLLAERWGREQILLREAERSILDKVDIDRLVEDYRSSLILLNYEKELVDNYLDTMISDDAYKEAYKTYKENYRLDQPIIRCYFVKAPENQEGLDKFDEVFRKGHTTEIKEYTTSYGNQAYVDKKRWFLLSDILSLMPSELIATEEWKKGNTIQKNQGDFEYFLKIIAVTNEGKIPPIEFIRDKIKNLILHKRKIDLLEKYKTQQYDKFMKKVKINI